MDILLYRLSMHNELHQKYPRQHPPSGNSALINPADSVDLYQLPPHFVEGILGLGKIIIIYTRVTKISSS